MRTNCFIIKCQKCGKEFEYNQPSLYGGYDASWIARNIKYCKSCYYKEMVKNDDTLIGSDKQVSWATNIKRNFIKKSFAKDIENKIATKIEASWWIENRNILENAKSIDDVKGLFD